MHIPYHDGRPHARLRLAARDQGVVFTRGEGPLGCDQLTVREANVFVEDGVYHLFYDGGGPRGWLACLATSRDLRQWERHGPVLNFGVSGSPDSATAASPWVIHDGTEWHMFYVASPNASPAPEYIPAFPYLTLKATAPKLKGPWEKHYELRPFFPQPGTWCADTASPGFIIRHEGEYLQFFSGSYINAAGVVKRTLGLARTQDLNGAWTMEPEPLFSPDEQIENTSLYFEPANQHWFLFTNHVGLQLNADGSTSEYTDAIWVYWSKNPRVWEPDHKAVVLDSTNCTWSRECIGMPTVILHQGKLALLYDACAGDLRSNLHRDIGLAWIDLPLAPPV